MIGPDVEALQARLSALERRLWRVSAAWMATLVLAVVLGVGAQHAFSQSTSLRTQQLNIVDGAGRVQLTVGLSKAGHGGLWLYDAGGKVRGFLGFSGSGALTPELALSDENEQDRLYLGWSVSEKPTINVDDTAGKIIWSAP